MSGVTIRGGKPSVVEAQAQNRLYLTLSSDGEGIPLFVVYHVIHFS